MEKATVPVPKSLAAACVLGLVSLCLAGSDLLAQRPQRPALFLREDWTFAAGLPNVNTPQEPEHPVVQGDVANLNLDVHLWGDKTGLLTVNQPDNNNLTYVMTLLCTTSCAVSFRDRTNDVDLTGLATIRWRTRVSGFHLLRPIVKLADGTWLVGDHATAQSSGWVESEIQLADVRWRNLNIDGVIEGRGGDRWVETPNLSRVEEIGFTDLMRGGGHGAPGSRIDWIEVYGKPVRRVASSTALSK
jgi:hypothetical protein